MLKIEHFLRESVLEKKSGTYCPQLRSTQKQRKFLKKCTSPPLVMCGTVKQEVDIEEEEAALFDNTKWCKDTAKYDTCRTHTHTDDTGR